MNIPITVSAAENPGTENPRPILLMGTSSPKTSGDPTARSTSKSAPVNTPTKKGLPKKK